MSKPAEDRKHVRVYYSIVDDPKFETIYGHDAKLATWLRLLMAADAVWPASAHIPRGTRQAPLQALAEAGIIDLLPGERFRIHGLDPERGRRQESARNAAVQRWQSEGTADAMQAHSGRIPVPDASREEKSRAGLNRAEQDARKGDPEWDDPEHEARAWLSVHGCDIRPGNGYDQKLVLAVERHGVNAVVGMFDRLAGAGTKDGDIKGFLFGAIDALDARTRPSLVALEQQEREEERAIARRNRKPDPLREQIREAVEASYPPKVVS